LIIRSSY